MALPLKIAFLNTFVVVSGLSLASLGGDVFLFLAAFLALV
jgi:hypothetical protein